MQITLICGSNAQKSHTKALLIYIEKLLKSKRIKTSLWDFKEKPLPIVAPEYHKDPAKTPNEFVREFIKLIDNSDGFVLGSPLYHGSYSGVLKNALDNLYYDAFRNKPIALVSNSSSIRNCAHPCEHLRLVVRALYGYVSQSQIGTVNTDFTDKGKEYELTNEEIKERCSRLVNELVSFAKVLQENKINEG